jgi:hypothetical protein
VGTKEEQARSLLDDLRRPEAYPAPRPSQVAQVTTHISWVFLTDRDVWKLKRPVDYGFVNYTTLERRRRCCEDEVRLNRRLAPDVYLGSFRSGSAPRVTGSTPMARSSTTPSACGGSRTSTAPRHCFAGAR